MPPVRNSTQQSHMRLSAGALLVLAVLAGSPVQATEPARHVIEQPSQAMADSLRSIARQTGASVLFDPAVVNGRMARPVSGRLSAAEAISRAIDGSGLAADVMKDGAIVVRPTSSPGSAPPSPSGAGARSTRSAAVAAAAEVGQTNVAQAGVSVSAAGAGRPEAPEGTAAGSDRIVITGSRLKRVASEGPVPVNSYSREEIERSGQPTLERFLQSLNEVTITPGEGAFGTTSGQGTVQLRGLPVGSTLVLINGRRLQAVGSSSGNLFNLNLIPMAAVERVEVVPVGSSAVYGGDALAGVVNVILKRSLDGYSASARVASGRGVGDGQFSIATGGQGDKGSFMLLGAISKSTPLTMAEREFFLDADFRRFGGIDARSRLCTPGTVTSTTGVNLPGLSSSFAGIPSVASGALLTAADFAATAGQANLCNSQANGNGYSLTHAMQSASLHAVTERHLGAEWSLFGELTFARDRLESEEVGLGLNNVLVPASNPYNPFGVPVRVTARLGLENGNEGLVRNTDYMRALVGVRGQLGAGWELEAAVSTSQDRGDRRQLNGTVNTAARDAALAAPSRDAALNPFTAGRAGNEDVLRRIWTDGLRDNDGQKDQLTAFARGSVGSLPAGAVDAIVGIETGRDRYATAVAGGSTYDVSRNSGALFGEVRLPLLKGESSTGPTWSLAAMTLAARRDRYSDFGSANTYQAGLEIRPARNLLFRGAAATSFKPPTLLQSNVSEQSFTTELYGLRDPVRGNAPITGGEVLRTTNRQLQPEEGRAYSLGAVWEPEFAAGSRLSLTAWRVQIDDLIGLLWPQIPLDNEALFPELVVRGPAVGGVPGPVTRVIYTEVNFGRVETAGLDLEAMQSWRGQGGRWTLAASATRANRYRVQLAPGAPEVDRLGRRFSDYWAPTWKARSSIGFDAGAWSASATGRYLGSYKDAGTSERKLGGRWLLDVSASLNLRRIGLLSGAATKAATLSVGVVNLTNQLPEFVAASPYYDVTQADWRGRYGSVRLTVDW